MLVPFTSREDIDFFQHLEMHMRAESSNLVGRDHLSFRSSYVPCKSVTDGDLCEQFNSLEPAKKRGIADSLDRTPNEARQPLTPTWKAAAFHCALFLYKCRLPRN
ncbi:Splicing factor 3B subunit 3 [Geodia barretti]|uniref:Splicing factor 3B subunit 3 n=1 Tax=Geodia barretti TaxID=519541 RepID=A0AA35XKF9_GEOBA|nr:Splicing factor 3B subunit 3 [Geodia barretti]